MGRYMRECKGIGAVTVMEKTAETPAAAAGRKRKAGLGETEVVGSSVQLKSRHLAAAKPENSASPASSGDSTCESDGSVSDRGLASSCSSNGLSTEMTKGQLKSVDLEEENQVSVELHDLTTSAGDWVDCRDRRELTPSSWVRPESGELQSTATPEESNSQCHRIPVSKMPSEAEFEEFFAAAEKNLRKEFIDKYNYDIVKDQPLAGRYEWVEIRP